VSASFTGNIGNNGSIGSTGKNRLADRVTGTVS